MQLVSTCTKCLISALIIIGALIACSPIQTPVAITTATVIPSTATLTSTPTTPTAVPPASATPIIFSTQAPIPITPILESSVELDMPFTQDIMAALANYLDIPQNRVQLVSVESAEWNADTLGCTALTSLVDSIDLSNYIGDNEVMGFRYVLLVGNTLYEYHTEGLERFLRCQGHEVVSGEVLVAVDPLAAETLRVVQNLVAAELDLSSRRVQLVDMLPVTWEDTSLGCPQPEQTYTQTEIQGYHIVVTVGDELFIYHSDSNTAYPCPLEQSIIPAN